MKFKWLIFTGLCVFLLSVSCSEDDDMPEPEGKDPDTAEEVSVDRFSESTATLMVRTEENGLPEANESVDFDQAPFITAGFGPDGQRVEYYNFDVQPTDPAPIYVFFREGESAPAAGQLNVIDVIPGDAGYSDFWQVVKVTVPADYVVNSVTSLSELNSSGYGMEEMNAIVNCPVTPKGSTASKRLNGGSNGLTRGWYKGDVVYYFDFSEASLEVNSAGEVPLSPIYVTFNINPDQEGGGPASGFVVEDGTDQSHNVIATIPGDAGYSPLWLVNIYDNSDFATVSDLSSAQDANILVTGAANVNCPVVVVE